MDVLEMHDAEKCVFLVWPSERGYLSVFGYLVWVWRGVWNVHTSAPKVPRMVSLDTRYRFV